MIIKKLTPEERNKRVVTAIEIIKSAIANGTQCHKKVKNLVYIKTL